MCLNYASIQYIYSLYILHGLKKEKNIELRKIVFINIQMIFFDFILSRDIF